MSEPGVEELRQVVGKVAHDLGNNLQVILGRAFLLEHRLGETPAAADAAAINEAAEQAVALTNRLADIALGRD